MGSKTILTLLQVKEYHRGQAGHFVFKFYLLERILFPWNVPTIVPSSLPGDNLQAAAQEWIILLGAGDKKTRTELRSENTKKGGHCRECSEDCQGVTANLGWNSGVCNPSAHTRPWEKISQNIGKIYTRALGMNSHMWVTEQLIFLTTREERSQNIWWSGSGLQSKLAWHWKYRN